MRSAEWARTPGISFSPCMLGTIETRAENRSPFRLERQQAAQRMTRPFCRIAFQRFTDGKKEDHGSCFTRLTDQDRPHGGDAHQ